MVAKVENLTVKILEQIRDEIRGTNTRLGQVEETLNARLGKVEETLRRAGQKEAKTVNKRKQQPIRLQNETVK